LDEGVPKPGVFLPSGRRQTAPSKCTETRHIIRDPADGAKRRGKKSHQTESTDVPKRRKTLMPGGKKKSALHEGKKKGPLKRGDERSGENLRIPNRKCQHRGKSS